MTNYAEKRAAQKAELSKLTEAELRDKWSQYDYTLWQMGREADRRGYSTPGDDYMGSDLSEECDIINEILKERGLAEQERPAAGGDEEEEHEPA